MVEQGPQKLESKLVDLENRMMKGGQRQMQVLWVCNSDRSDKSCFYNLSLKVGKTKFADRLNMEC